MSINNIEEKSPLLFVLDGNEDISKGENAYFGQNRFRGIAHGATAVFTHFPNFIGTCWIVTALFGLVFFMIILLLLSTITTAGLRVPRCVAAEDVANKTIHLVHLHHPAERNAREAKLLEEIIKRYPSFKIHLISIREARTSLSHKSTKSSTIDTTSPSKITPTSNDILVTLIRRKRKIEEARYSPFNINMEAKRLIDMLLHGKLDDKYEQRHARSTFSTESSRTTTIPTTSVEPIRTVDYLASIYSNIDMENLTYSQAFSFSPLHHNWPHLNEKLRIFAVRVLQLWQFGGISFDLQAPLDMFEHANATERKLDGRKARDFVLSEKLDYEKLPVGVVEVDEDASHMESKVPCHAFFGEIVMNLRKAASDSTVRDIMRKSIKVFCKHFAASKKYCDSFNNQ